MSIILLFNKFVSNKTLLFCNKICKHFVNYFVKIPL